ncbi:hypothetical protein [Thermoflavimicrobium daqui]|uniref:DUF4352 domain-containing protein n=1 Tax=Thermoflavimicrobium daqui TaxID=2137476 RepID=A0A364K6S8_9BACL|nr:hypothetical protein [Thermoflavimicrobium daqui]RAL26011.1 hypothetical protein DL897_08080 [Thermoflavimicrobium daqui]
MLKRFFIGLFALSFLGASVYFAGGFGIVIKKERSQVAAQQKKPKPKETKQVKMGETIEIQDVKVSVDFARARQVGLFGDGAPLNDHFVYIDMIFEQSKDRSTMVTILNRLKLVDANQKQYTNAVKPIIKTLDSTDHKVLGKIAFDVSNSDSYELIYDDSKANVRYVCKLKVADLPNLKQKKTKNVEPQTGNQ